jgi:hypothetical protein
VHPRLQSAASGRPLNFTVRPLMNGARVLGLLIIASQVACVPTRYMTPALTGRVTTAHDDRPVTGAIVTETVTKRQAVSGDDGTFLLPEKEVWGILSMPGHLSPVSFFRVSVRANGYKPSEFPLKLGDDFTNGAPRELKEPLRLQPAG